MGCCAPAPVIDPKKSNNETFIDKEDENAVDLSKRNKGRDQINENDNVKEQKGFEKDQSTKTGNIMKDSAVQGEILLDADKDINLKIISEVDSSRSKFPVKDTVTSNLEPITTTSRLIRANRPRLLISHLLDFSRNIKSLSIQSVQSEFDEIPQPPLQHPSSNRPDVEIVDELYKAEEKETMHAIEAMYCRDYGRYTVITTECYVRARVPETVLLHGYHLADGCPDWKRAYQMGDEFFKEEVGKFMMGMLHKQQMLSNVKLKLRKNFIDDPISDIYWQVSNMIINHIEVDQNTEGHHGSNLEEEDDISLNDSSHDEFAMNT